MTQLFEVLGGLGVFLLGVIIMTDGLKGIAGDALRSALTRFTHSPLSGACTGAVSTAILQSSSATTVAAVGFVGAGLLTFPQALGVVFGANLGTTITGWLVALLGFKLKIGSVVLPLVLAGVLMRLFGNGRLARGGLALAGFGLIFVGIAAMQSGMGGLEGQVSPDSFPPDTVAGRLKLVLIGILVTVITQSSSAGVAAALTAVYTGTISFPQAAAMVIGMDIGTTATAFFATLGGSTESRRTGYSHVIYNLCTGAGAFLLLTPYTLLWETLSPGSLSRQPEIALVAFHTSFNVMGVAAVLPFTHRFGRFITRLVPDRGSILTDRLDKTLLAEPFVALEAVRRTLEVINLRLLQFTTDLMQRLPHANAETLAEFEQAIETTQRYQDQIHSSPEHSREWEFLMSCIHCIDHMQRLVYRLQQNQRAQGWRKWPVLNAPGTGLLTGLPAISKAAAKGNWELGAQSGAELAKQIQDQAEQARTEIMFAISTGREDTVAGDLQLDSARWMRRVATHLWRISHYMHAAGEASQMATAASPLPEHSAVGNGSPGGK